MESTPLVGHVVPRAVLQQQAALRGADPPAAVSALQDSDDVVRINSMLEVGVTVIGYSRLGPVSGCWSGALEGW